MTVVLHPVNLHRLATDLADVPGTVTLLPLTAALAAPAKTATQVLMPADDRELEALLPRLDGPEPTLVLLGGPEVLRVHDQAIDPHPGQGEILVEGDPDGVCLLACGAQVGEALAATMDLQTQGVRPRIVNLSSLQPLDEDLVKRCADECRALVVVEAPLPDGLDGLATRVERLFPDGPPTPITVVSEGREPNPDEDEALVRPFGPTARDIRVTVTRMVKVRW